MTFGLRQAHGGFSKSAVAERTENTLKITQATHHIRPQHPRPGCRGRGAFSKTSAHPARGEKRRWARAMLGLPPSPGRHQAKAPCGAQKSVKNKTGGYQK